MSPAIEPVTKNSSLGSTAKHLTAWQLIEIRYETQYRLVRQIIVVESLQKVR